MQNIYFKRNILNPLAHYCLSELHVFSIHISTSKHKTFRALVKITHYLPTYVQI